MLHFSPKRDMVLTVRSAPLQAAAGEEADAECGAAVQLPGRPAGTAKRDAGPEGSARAHASDWGDWGEVSGGQAGHEFMGADALLCSALLPAAQVARFPACTSTLHMIQVSHQPQASLASQSRPSQMAAVCGDSFVRVLLNVSPLQVCG